MSKANYTLKSAKEGMDLVVGFHESDFGKADSYITRKKRLDAFKTMIETNRVDLDRLNSGDASGILRSAEEIKAEIEDFESKANALKEEIAKVVEEFNKSIANARKLVTDCEPFMNAIREYYSDTYKEGAFEKLVMAWRLWVSFTILNIENKDDLVDEESIIGQVYNFIGGAKGSNKTKCQTNKHLKYNFKDVELADKALGAFCDDPSVVKVLPKHKWVNKIEISAKKASKDANK